MKVTTTCNGFGLDDGQHTSPRRYQGGPFMSQARVPAWISVGAARSQYPAGLPGVGHPVLLPRHQPHRGSRNHVVRRLRYRRGDRLHLYYATGFIFTGLAVAVAFHAGLFNIGGEGQAYIGGPGRSGLSAARGRAAVRPAAAARHHRRRPVRAAWAFIPAWLRQAGSHIIVITTIMFNFIAAS